MIDILFPPGLKPAKTAAFQQRIAMTLSEHPTRTFHYNKSQSPVRKRSVSIGVHKTSVSLEPEFWFALKAIAAEENIEIGRLLERIDEQRERSNLSSACRVFVLKHLQQQLRAAGPA